MSQGGKREGAGRKEKYGEETVNIAIRVPISKKEEVKQVVKRFLSKFVVEKEKKV